MEAKRLCSDMISNLPPPIIETILCLVPIEEAVRTSILSTEWRYKWINIPKLVFDVDTVNIPVSNDDDDDDNDDGDDIENKTRRKLFSAINQVLLMHQGPIHEFTLSASTDENSVEIDNIITHLASNNAVKKLKLVLTEYRLPVSLFSLHHLTDLYLNAGKLDHEPPFSGFGSLTSLYIEYVNTTKKTLLHLLSNCPLLKSFTLGIDDRHIQGIENSTISNLFECLPMIENLSIWLPTIEGFAQGGVPIKLPTALVHLKYLCIDLMCFIRNGLPILSLLIRSSPNLKKLKLEMSYASCIYGSDTDSVAMEDYSDIWLKHLNELEIIYFKNKQPELNFVKLILAKSPVLKNVRIILWKNVSRDEKWHILRVFSGSPRASSVVKFFIKEYCCC